MSSTNENASPKPTPPPSPWLLMLEGRAVWEFASSFVAMPWLRQAPRGDGHPVVVLPGFLASDLSTRPLRRFLRGLGYVVRPWGFGRNLGPVDDLEERMRERIRYFHRLYDRKISLVGWSLGGVYAREIAREVPEAIRQVITLGSPFGHPRANHSWRLFEWLSGRSIDDIGEERFDIMREPPPVPSTAIVSRTDGVTNWQVCVERDGPQSETIEVPGSHLGLGFNPAVLWATADRLAQPEDDWRRFESKGLGRFLYRGAADRGAEAGSP